MFKWAVGVLVAVAAGQCVAQVARCVTPRGDITYSELGCARYEKAQSLRPPPRFEIAPGANAQPVLTRPRPLVRHKPKPKVQSQAQAPVQVQPQPQP